MNLRDLSAEEGRRAFGENAANYDAARPPYPDWVFDTLQSRCGLGPGTRLFEIGPGTGLATAQLAARGATEILAIEPDARLADFLARKFAGLPGLTVMNTTFEDAKLEAGRFDLGAAATSLHWMDQRAALAKVANALRSGGWWAAWWNVYGDPERDDAFHEATKDLLANQPKSPSHYAGLPHPFGLDTQTRLGDLEAIGAFEEMDVDIRKWTVTMSSAEVRAFYATFSQFSVLEPSERERLLDGLAEIADKQFAGRVERNICTALYTARRR